MTVLRRLTAAGAGISAAVLLIAPTAHAATVGYTTTTDPVQAAAGWLATQFIEDSTHLPAPDGDHFGGSYPVNKKPMYFANYGENADAIFGLASAKSAGDKIAVALDYLKKNVDAYADISNTDGYGTSDGALAKLAVAAQVAGADPTSFGGYNLLAQLKTDECSATSTSCTPGSAANLYASISESLVVIAEARAGGNYAPSKDALDYFTSLQCASGGFTDKTAACGTGDADIDSTSYAIMALAAEGGHSTELLKAVTWLRAQQNAGGYWIAQNIPNANSTGLAASALSSQNVDVSSARTWLRSQQVARGSAGAGAIKYGDAIAATTTSATSLSVLATAQALTGLVDGGSLATLKATGASAAVTMYAPVAKFSSSTAKPGAAQTVTATGFVPGEQVHVVIHSTPATVATVTAGTLGAVSARYTLPKALSGGRHSVVLTGATSALSVSEPLTVTAPATSSSSAGSSSNSSSNTAGAGTSTTGTTTTATGSLADTGQNTEQLDDLAVVGGIAVLAGFALLVGGRRRAGVNQVLRAVSGRHRTPR